MKKNQTLMLSGLMALTALPQQTKADCDITKLDELFAIAATDIATKATCEISSQTNYALAAKELCPDLPWALLDQEAYNIFVSDQAVKLGTSCMNYLEMTDLNASQMVMAAYKECRFSSLDLATCIKGLACQDARSCNSPDYCR